MTWGRGCAWLVAVAAVAFLLAPAGASANTVKHFGELTEVRVDSEGGCEKSTLFRWSELPGATSYHLVIDDTLGFNTDIILPPYHAESEGPFGGMPPVAKGQHRVVLTYQGGGVGGCQTNDVARFTVREFTASFCDVIPTARPVASRADKCESRIVGTATEPDGRPIDGVRISISGSGNAKTDAGGSYGTTVKAGRHTVSAPKGFCVKGGGKCSRSTSVDVKSGKTEAVHFVRRAEDLVVSGTITDEFGRKLDGVTTSLTGPDAATDVTDGSGKYRLEVGEPGTYELTAVGSNRGPYELYYIRLDDGTASSGRAADVTLGDTVTSQTVDWELDRRLQFRLDIPRVQADGVSHYPLALRALTQRGDPAADVEMVIDPAVQTNGRPRSVICSDKFASGPLWPTLNTDGTVSPVGLRPGIPETMTDETGTVPLDLFPGTEPGGLTISGGRRGDAASTFFATIPFSPPLSGSFSMESVRNALTLGGSGGTSAFGSQDVILDLIVSARGLSSDFSAIDAVPVVAGGKSGLAFFKLGSPPTEGVGGSLPASSDIFVYDDAWLGRIQEIPTLPTLAQWAAGQPITIKRTDRRTFVQWPLPTISEGGLGTCLKGAPADTMSFALHSPAHLLLTDKQGNKIGFDARGKKLNSGTGAALRVDGDDRVIVPTGEYKLTVAGTGSGPVAIEARSGSAVSVAQFKAKKGEVAKFSVKGSTLLPKQFKFGGRKVKSSKGVPLEVKGLPKKLREGKRSKLKLQVSDAFGDPVPFPVLRTSGAAGSVTAYGDEAGRISTRLKPRKAGSAKLKISAIDVLTRKIGVKVAKAKGKSKGKGKGKGKKG